MIKLWICLALLSIGISAFSDVGQDDIGDAYYDDWYVDDVGKLGLLSTELKEPAEEVPVKDLDTVEIENKNESIDDNRVEEEIQQFRNDIENHIHDDFGLNYDQFEDNRSIDKDENDAENKPLKSSENKSSFQSDEDFADSDSLEMEFDKMSSKEINDLYDDAFDQIETSTEGNNIVEPETNNVISKELKDKSHDNNTVQSLEDQIESESVYNQKIFDETVSTLKSDTVNDFDVNNDKESVEVSDKLNDIIKETKRILEETSDNLEEENKAEETEETNSSEESDEDQQQVNTSTESTKEVNDVMEAGEDVSSNEKTDNLFIADFNEDQNSEDETMDVKEVNEITKQKVSDKTNTEESQESFDLFDDLDELRKSFSELSKDNLDGEELNSKEDYEEISDDNLDQLFKKSNDNDKSTTETNKENPTIHKVEKLDLKDNLFINDDLIDEVVNEVADKENTELITEHATEKNLDDIDTKNLTNSEYDKLMRDFKEKNSIDVKSNDVTEYYYIKLSVDEPTVITSPGYPNPYPTNSVTDWLLTGDGMGIEFNVTDFAVNGHAGHFLLVKPGGMDASGRDGLVFSYSLSHERRYRFFDVDRLFMRLEAQAGWAFHRGFNVSARMIMSNPTVLEVAAEPEPSPIRAPEHTITLNLGGLSLDQFVKVEDSFRAIVADMAAMYITANEINPGLNTTLEGTQILSRALCFHNWPKYELCAEVKFGVALVYEDPDEEPRLTEEELMEMWTTYSQRDPFDTRLRMLGITEFQVPNDRGVMVVWLVIASGVVLSMAMLAFALWRFTCFEDYTRMKSFSETDSVSEKRKLELYPTPHQALPPLYGEADYKWADYEDDCKVDVGGFNNKNFLPDDLFSVDSDDEVAPNRNRYTTDV